MANPRRMVRRSLVANALSPRQAKERRREIAQHSSLRRAGMMAVHACATKKPKLTAGLMGLRYQEWGGEYVGSGFEFTVFRTPEDEVLKIAHGTIGMPPHKQAAYATRRESEYTSLSRWMGGFILPQAIEVAPLPFLPSQTAVQVRQPYEQITDPLLFQRDTPYIDPLNIAGVRIGHPDIRDQLLDFIERGRALYGAEELLPDTNGSANLVLADENFILVDGTPIGREHPRIQGIILGQLTSLELAIA